MEANIEFLGIYSQVAIAYVAFTVIVATLRQSLGEPLIPFEYLLVRFFVEVGLIHYFHALIGIALFHTLKDTATVWLIMTWLALGTVSAYLPYYIARRRRVRAIMPISTLLIMIGYGITTIINILTITGIWWEASLLTVSLYLLWVSLGNIVVFLVFLGGFLRIATVEEDVTEKVS